MYPKIPIPMVQSQMSSQDGTAQQTTAKVFNKQVGRNELTFTLANTGGADLTNVVIFPFASTSEALPANTTLTTVGFTNRAEMVEYYKRVGTTLAGVQMDTDDIENYENMSFVQQEQAPDGSKSQEILFPVSDYRISTGGGNDYSRTLKLTEDDYAVVMWPGLRFSINYLKAGTKIKFKFKTVGVTKGQEISAIAAKTL